MKADSQDFIAITTLVVDAMNPLCASQKNWRRRVAYRVQAGGHPVAANTIRERYHRLWALIAELIARCDQATVYDNSGIKGPLIVAQVSDGFIVGSPVWPHWAPSVLQSRWPTG